MLLLHVRRHVPHCRLLSAVFMMDGIGQVCPVLRITLMQKITVKTKNEDENERNRIQQFARLDFVFNHCWRIMENSCMVVSMLSVNRNRTWIIVYWSVVSGCVCHAFYGSVGTIGNRIVAR